MALTEDSGVFGTGTFDNAEFNSLVNSESLSFSEVIDVQEVGGGLVTLSVSDSLGFTEAEKSALIDTVTDSLVISDQVRAPTIIEQTVSDQLTFQKAIIDNFEDGDVTEWTGDTGSFSADDSTVLEGAYSGKLESANTSNSVTLSGLTPQAENEYRFKIRIGSDTGDSGDLNQVSFYSGNDIQFYVRFQDSTNEILLSGIDTGSTWSPDTTYDVRIVFNRKTDQVDLYVDGTLIDSRGYIQVAGNRGDVNEIRFRNTTSNSGATRSSWIDSIERDAGGTQFALVDTFSDTAAFSENLNTQLLKAVLLQETLAVNENLSTRLEDTVDDSVDFVENLKSRYRDVLTEQLGFSDQIAQAIISDTLADQLNLSENLQAAISLTLEDNLGLSDEVATAIAATLTDQLTLSEQIEFLLSLDVSFPLEALLTTPDSRALVTTPDSKGLITTNDTFAVMTDHTFKKGDTGDDLEATLEDDDGAIDLSGNGVDFYMQNTETDNMKIDGREITKVDASNGKVKVDWQSGDLDTVGVYRCEFVINTTDGETTVPNSGYVFIEVDDEVKN